MEALKTIGHSKYVGTMSPDGYPGAPTFEPEVTRPAYGWMSQAYSAASMTSTVPMGNEDYIQRIIRSLIVGVPDPTVYRPGDKVTLDGTDYVVSEDVRDYRTGPFSTGPGGEIIVERVTG